MPFTLTMPKLTPTMEGGTIVKWHKKEGDQVKDGDLLFEIATDKATVEHHALDAGFLRKLLVAEGEEALVNQGVAIFTEVKDESIEGYQVEGIKPQVAEEDTPIKEGGAPTQEVKSGATLKGGGLAQVAFAPEPPLERYEFEFAVGVEDRLSASPLAKKLAKERGVDISTVKGSGPHGRVMSRDLDLAQPSAFATFGNCTPPLEQPGTFVEEPLSPIRKAIGEKLQASKTFIPHFYVQQDINVQKMIDIRNQLKENGVNLTFNDFVMRAAALALKEHPVINSGFDSTKNAIVRFKTVDIAVAVSIDEGLITPIVRHVDCKNLGQISTEVKYLATLAKKGKLQSHEYRGGSFTISNLGMFGIHSFQAVINPPQVSILAVGGVRECPVLEKGCVVPGKRMMISLSSDHRVVDGTDAAKFLNTFQKLLENPAILLI